MAFASAIISKNGDEVPERIGRKRMTMGTFTNTAGSSGGEVVTGLQRVEDFFLQHTGAAVVASDPVANETIPLEKGDVTIVTTADADGIWMAVGL